MHKTILFVTHDVEEAFRLGDQIAVLSEGKLVQLGTPIDLLAHPANDFVRKLVGADNMLRQLEYLPVSTALDHEYDNLTSSKDIPRCSSTATLLQVMLSLIETNSNKLVVFDEETQEPIGYVTLSSINREISRFHRDETSGEVAKI